MSSFVIPPVYGHRRQKGNELFSIWLRSSRGGEAQTEKRKQSLRQKSRSSKPPTARKASRVQNMKAPPAIPDSLIHDPSHHNKKCAYAG